jgi:uncharacterized protein (DUF433 family)
MAAIRPCIVSDLSIMLGNPTIGRTRITVEHVLRQLGLGMTPEEIVAAHPGLDLETVAQRSYPAQGNEVPAALARSLANFFTVALLPGTPSQTLKADRVSAS